MEELLTEVNDKIHKGVGEKVTKLEIKKITAKYDKILKQGDKECPAPKPPPGKKKGRLPEGKSRNLLERSMNHKEEVLKCLKNP